MFPPSPALSATDSLDGIDDLDAFLAAQGVLSRFPTPPLGQHQQCRGHQRSPHSIGPDTPHNHHYTHCAHSCDDACGIEPDARRVDVIDETFAAQALAQEAIIIGLPSAGQIDCVRRMLTRADLPRETLGLALNLIIAFRQHLLMTGMITELSCDQIVVSACELAVSYTADHPPSKSWWSRHVCQSSYAVPDIDAASREILHVLDWRLHEHTSEENLAVALRLLNAGSSCISTISLDKCAMPLPLPRTDWTRLRLCIEDSHIAWEHGQLTPEERWPLDLTGFSATPAGPSAASDSASASLLTTSMIPTARRPSSTTMTFLPLL